MGGLYHFRRLAQPLILFVIVLQRKHGIVLFRKWCRRSDSFGKML